MQKFQFKNNSKSYGIISIVLHWLSAIAIFALFALGFWMVDLDYYSSWYVQAPMLHISFVLLLVLMTIWRIFWYLISKPPPSLNSSWQKVVEKIAHIMLYVLLCVILISGYLIVSADERNILFFNIISIPTFVSLTTNAEDISGEIHELASYVLIALALLHTMVAFWHHFVKKDVTLVRMNNFLKKEIEHN